MEKVQTQQFHPRMEELSSCVVQHRAPTPPQAPQGICLGMTPSPLGHREAKWAGIQDCNHPAKVKGSGYEVGLFVLDWLQESRCSAAASHIIGLITDLYTYFLFLVKKTRNQPFPRDHQQQKALSVSRIHEDLQELQLYSQK